MATYVLKFIVQAVDANGTISAEPIPPDHIDVTNTVAIFVPTTPAPKITMQLDENKCVQLDVMELVSSPLVAAYRRNIGQVCAIEIEIERLERVNKQGSAPTYRDGAKIIVPPLSESKQMPCAPVNMDVQITGGEQGEIIIAKIKYVSFTK